MTSLTIAVCFLLAVPAALVACAPKVQAPPCCATLGYNRIQVESVLGSPTPPQPSKYHALPSPPPGASIYTTEHGYLTVTYFDMTTADEQHFSKKFYEGKDSATPFSNPQPYW
jgi:hypothetical protein